MGALIYSVLDRYIGRSIAVATAIVLGVLAALFVFVAFVDGLSDYGKGSFGLYELARYVILSQPRKLYEAFPIAMLIGALLGLSSLAINSELVAMRAAGVSKARIVGSAMKTGLLFVVLALLAGEYVVPRAETEAQTGRAQALEAGFKQKGGGVWLRDGRSFVNFREVLPDLSLLGVQIYDFGPDFRLRQHILAQRAVYEGRQWRLEQVRVSELESEQVLPVADVQRVWSPRLTPEVVAVYTVRPEALSIAQLGAYVEHLRDNGQETARYALALWQKALMPLATAIMILLAAPFVFRSARSGGLAQRLFVGILLGLAFVVVSRSLGSLGLLYGISPLLSAGLPLLLFLVLAGILLRRVR